MSKDNRQAAIERIEASIGTLVTMAWDKLSDEDLQTLNNYVGYAKEAFQFVRDQM